MLDQIASGAIGAVRNVRCAFTFDITTRPGDVRLIAALAGGSLLDVGCYPLNLSRAVYGRAPQAATARVIVPPGSEVERTTAAVLDFGQDRLAVIDGSFDQPEHQFAEVVGERGRIFLPRPFTPFLTEPVVRIEREGETIEHQFAAVDQYRLQVEHFAECIRTGAQPMLTPADALEQAESIELIYRAAGYQRPW
jgi:predicted dehydrogenase